MPRARRGSRSRSGQHDLAVLPLINTVIFPRAVTPLYVSREQSLRAVEAATTNDANLLVVAQRDGEKETVGPDDLYEIGVEADIGRVLKMPDGHTSVLVQGLRRVRIVGVEQQEPYLVARVEPITEEIEKTTAI